MTPADPTTAATHRLQAWRLGVVCLAVAAATGCSKRTETPPPPPAPPAAVMPPPAEAKPAYADFVGTWAGHTTQPIDKGEVSGDLTVTFKSDGHFSETDTCVLAIEHRRAVAIHYVVTEDGTWGYDGNDLVMTVTNQHGSGVSDEDNQRIFATESLRNALNQPPAEPVRDHVTDWKSDSFMCNPVEQTAGGPTPPFKLIRLSK